MEINLNIHFKGQIIRLGRLWLRSHSGRESASFEYSEAWLQFPQAFALAPGLPLTRGAFHTSRGRKVFSFLSDCLPDRWGRTIVLRQETRRAKKAKEIPRTLLEADFLLAVNDTARIGALRFIGPAGGQPPVYVPSMHFLGQLLAASDRLQKNMESEEDLRLLFAPGSSLGGARPKAAVEDAQGNLWIAKFPSVQDYWDVPLWEYVSLKLARESGLSVPEFRLETVMDKNILLVKRFDREGTERIPFASAMTLLDLQDMDHGSYIELAEIVRQYGSCPADDSKEIWKRMVFNAMTSNVDDHLRNHAFLRDSSGWRLSPVYDLESSPPAYKAPFQHTALYPGAGLHLDDVFESALAASGEFGLSLDEARREMENILKAGKRWALTAKATGASKADMDTMESAFRLRTPAGITNNFFIR